MAYLINLARKTNKRDIRDSIVPQPNSTAKVGKNYNDCLTIFVNDYRDITIARRNSQSLNKTIMSLENYNPIWT